MNSYSLLNILDSRITEHADLGEDVSLVAWIAENYDPQPDQIDLHSQGYMESRNIQIYHSYDLRGYVFLTVTPPKSEF